MEEGGHADNIIEKYVALVPVGAEDVPSLPRFARSGLSWRARARRNAGAQHRPSRDRRRGLMDFQPETVAAKLHWADNVASGVCCRGRPYRGITAARH
jgi:hypothetical protein